MPHRSSLKRLTFLTISLAAGAILVAIASLALLFLIRPGALYNVVTVLRYSAAQNVPIHFYGRVVDQDNHGVPDMTVIMETGHLARNTATTDAHGNFTLSGITGSRVRVERIVARPAGDPLRPLAYRFEEHTIPYDYSGDSVPIFHPDPASPIVFHVWRNSFHYPTLAGFNADASLSGSGSTLSVWLGSPSRTKLGSFDDADLQITLTYTQPRNPEAPNGPDSRFDWTCTLTVPHGGIAESTDAYPYRAPTTGYHPEFTLHARAADPDWYPGIDNYKHFYLHLRGNSLYANFGLQCRISAAAPGRATVSFSGAMNPDGSTSLETPPKPE